jgi:hypothetical protein
VDNLNRNLSRLSQKVDRVVEELGKLCEETGRLTARFSSNQDPEWTRVPPWGIVEIPAIAGKVVGVSNRHNLVVINVGEDDGVQIGFQFTVYRRTEYVAKLVVEKVYPNQAAGRIVESSVRDKVLVGDKVATKID